MTSITHQIYGRKTADFHLDLHDWLVERMEETELDIVTCIGALEITKNTLTLSIIELEYEDVSL